MEQSGTPHFLVTLTGAMGCWSIISGGCSGPSLWLGRVAVLGVKTPKNTPLKAVGPLKSVTMLPRMGRCSVVPQFSVTHVGEVRSP